jgi:hypothetical protein
MNLTRIIDLKERIAISDAFKPDERNFILECINKVIADGADGLADTRKHRVIMAPCKACGIDTMHDIETGRCLRCEAPTVIHSPPNYLGRIESIWAALSIDEGGEGVCGAPMGQFGLVPLIAADKRRLDQIMPLARNIAKASRKPVRIAKFTKREDVEVYQP